MGVRLWPAVAPDARELMKFGATSTIPNIRRRQATHHGLSVPDDISLIAIHKLPAEDFRVPSMTCVEMPLKQLGRRAAELVLDLPWDAPVKETLQTELTISDGTTVASLPPATRGRRS